ncbi:hypothetical protein M0R45_030078 [Rubus argutus]|uniref:Retrotransposon gag protein n=1 Tax=Rubus argutus TaxID=59490 RepID=A0AAW1WBY5_RUBAR
MGTRKVTNLSMPSREPLKDGSVALSGSINVAQEFKKLESKIESLLESKLGHLVNQRASSPHPSFQEHKGATICLICDAHTHETLDCHLASSYSEFVLEYVNHAGVHKQEGGNPKNDPYSFTYNPGWRNHPNFAHGGNPRENNSQGGGGNHSYGQGGSHSFKNRSQGFNSYHGGDPQTLNTPLNFSQASPGTNSYGGPKTTYGATSSQPQVQEPTKPSLEDLLSAFVQKTDISITTLSQGQQALQQNVATLTQSVSALQQGQHNLQQGLHKMELQFGQLAKEVSARPRGALPSQVEPNPRGKSHEQVNAISTLRSGKLYDNKVHFDPLTYYDDPPSSTPFLVNCDNDIVYEENGAGGEENVPSGKLDLGDVVSLNKQRREKGVDKVADGEENVPTGGVSSHIKHPSKFQAPTSNAQVQASNPSSSTSKSHEQGIPLLGNQFGQLALDYNFEKEDYARRKHNKVFISDTQVSGDSSEPRDESHSGGKPLGEAMKARDPNAPEKDSRDTRASSSSNEPRRGPRCVPPLDMSDYEAPLPFPQVKRKEEVKKRQDKHKKKFFEMFKKVNLNVPLLDAIKQFPAYGRFLKELCTKKRKFKKGEQVILSEEISEILQGKLPPKLKDPGSFTVPCTIGSKTFDSAMMDLGASINLMPYHVYKTLGLDDINQDIKISLRMADRSLVFPRGVVENVLVKIEELYVPADFVILDMEESPHEEDEQPIILGESVYGHGGYKN